MSKKIIEKKNIICYNIYANKFAAGLGSIPSISSFIMTLLNIVTSGICYDAIRNFISGLKGGRIMRDMSVIMISWLCCCGDVV